MKGPLSFILMRVDSGFPSLQVAMSSFRDPEAASDEWLKSVLPLITEAEAHPAGVGSGDPSGALSELLKLMSAMGEGGMGGASSLASSSGGSVAEFQSMISSMLSGVSASGMKDSQGVNKEV